MDNLPPGDVVKLTKFFKDAHDELESRMAHYRDMLLSDLEECFDPEHPKDLLDTCYYDRYEVLLESHLAVVKKLRYNIDKLVRLKKGDGNSKLKGDVKAVSKQVYAALVAQRLDGFTTVTPEYCEEYLWHHISQLAVESSIALIKQWEKVPELQQQ